MNENSSSKEEVIIPPLDSHQKLKQPHKNSSYSCALCSCFMHIIIYFGVYLLLYVNYMNTANVLTEDSYIALQPYEVCDLYIGDLDTCLQRKDGNTTEEECQIIGEKLEKCVNNVYKFNEFCGMYLAEFVKCGNSGKQCYSLKMDVKDCGKCYTKSFYVDIIHNINEQILKKSDLVL